MLGRRLLNELAAISESFVLVLDDYHHIDQPAVHELVGRLLRYPPPSLHLVILTRRDPNLALSSLRARHRLLEIRPEDLRFDRRQTAAFMENALGLSLSGPALARLHSATEGWPVSLRLAAVALRHGSDAEELIRGLGGDSGQIREYLVEEILASQPAEIRESLYKISILERFCAPLCESVCGPCHVEGVTPDCAPVFDGLLQGAGLLTVPLDADREWCRFHHLFQEFLERQLERRTSAAERAALHRRASAWLARSGLIEEALRHALASGDVDSAVRLVDERGDETMNRQQWHRLKGWLELFPAEVVEATPHLLLLKALSFNYRYRWAEAWKILDQAEPLVAATPPEAASGRRLRGILAAVRCHRCYFAGEAERAVACGERALALLPPAAHDLRAFATTVLALSLQMRGDLDRACRFLYDALEELPDHRGTLSPRVFAILGLVHWVDGDLGSLEQVASNLLKLGEQLDLRESREWAGYFLGVVHYQRGELEAAREHLATAVEKRFLARTVVFLHGTTVLALCRLAQGRGDEARDLAESLVAHMLETGNTFALPLARAFVAEIALRQGRLTEARDWLRKLPRRGTGETAEPESILPMVMAYMPQLTLVKVLLADARPESMSRAETLLARLHEHASRVHNRRCRIEVLALQALLHQAREDEPAALEALEEAVTLAQPGGFVRLFVDLGPPMADLLDRLELDDEAARYVEQIRTAFPGGGTLPAAGSAAGAGQRLPSRGQPLLGRELLSRRELEVLAGVARRLSNKEIAGELGISSGTVKRHTHNIYAKLGTSDRREVVARAIELDLLPAG